MRSYTVQPLSPLLDYFGPDTTPATFASVANDPLRKSGVHRNNHDMVLQLVFSALRQLQSLAGLEHDRTIPSADAARNLDLIRPQRPDDFHLEWQSGLDHPFLARADSVDAGPLLRLSTCPLVVNFICHLLTNGCQFEKLLLHEGVFRGFGKLPIFRRLLPEII